MQGDHVNQYNYINYVGHDLVTPFPQNQHKTDVSEKTWHDNQRLKLTLSLIMAVGKYLSDERCINSEIVIRGNVHWNKNHNFSSSTLQIPALISEIILINI